MLFLVGCLPQWLFLASWTQFAGSPVSCAVGLAVLDVLEKEHLQAHADHVGEFLMGLLKQQREKHPIIGDVRSVGCFEPQPWSLLLFQRETGRTFLSNPSRAYKGWGHPVT